MRQNNPKDAQTLAEIIGTQENYDVTSQIASDCGGTGVGSVRSIREYIIHPDEIKRLGLGEAVVVNKQRFQMHRVQIRQVG